MLENDYCLITRGNEYPIVFILTAGKLIEKTDLLIEEEVALEDLTILDAINSVLQRVGRYELCSEVHTRIEKIPDRYRMVATDLLSVLPQDIQLSHLETLIAMYMYSKPIYRI